MDDYMSEYLTADTELPAVPEFVKDRRFIVDNNPDKEYTFAEVLFVFLFHEDAELLSPTGVYNLFMLDVLEELPTGDISIDIRRIL